VTAKLTKKGPGLKSVYDKIKKQVGHRHVVCGVLSSTAERDGEINNAALAMIHEFGSGRIPERSFLRSTFDAKQGSWLKLATRVLRAVAADKLSATDALSLVGERMKADIKHTITNKIEPGLASSTILRRIEGRFQKRFSNNNAKGGMLGQLKRAAKARQQMQMAAAVFGGTGGNFTPLVDSGRLLGSIDYEVRST
jgi:hypothetical protein